MKKCFRRRNTDNNTILTTYVDRSDAALSTVHAHRRIKLTVDFGERDNIVDDDQSCGALRAQVQCAASERNAAQLFENAFDGLGHEPLCAKLNERE